MGASPCNVPDNILPGTDRAGGGALELIPFCHLIGVECAKAVVQSCLLLRVGDGWIIQVCIAGLPINVWLDLVPGSVVQAVCVGSSQSVSFVHVVVQIL